MTTLTDRDLDIFSDFYKHHLLNTNHLASLHCHSEGHKQRLRRRLQKLLQAGYLQRLKTPIDQPRDYILSQRGMNALSNARHFAPRRINNPRSARSYRDHDIALSDFTVSMDLFVRTLAGAELINELELIHRSPRLDVRSHRGWPVSFRHDNERHEIWVKPDRFIAIKFADRPAHQNVRTFAIEIDRGSMPLETVTMQKASILRKLLAYQATHHDKVLREIFGIEHAYTLTLTSGRRRRDNMVALAANTLRSAPVAKSMLFAVQPPTPSVGDTPNLSELTWINGLGEEAALPL
jgi:hypothetical protein